MRLVRCGSGSSGSTRAAVSTTSSAVVGEHGRQVARELGLEVGVHLVGRVDQHEIVLPAGAGLARERRDGVLAQDGAAQPQLVEVALDRPHRVGVALDEDGARRAARERLEPHRAGARVEVEHRGAVERADEVEDVLAHAVGRRPRVEARRRLDRVPPVRAGDDPHAADRCRSVSCREAGVVRRRGDVRRSRSRPRRRGRTACPASSDGVSTRPAAYCTLYEPTGMRVVCSSRARRARRRRAASRRRRSSRRRGRRGTSRAAAPRRRRACAASAPS